MEANPEIRLRQGAKIVADVGVFCGHIDENAAIWQLLDELVLVRLQDAHETEVLGRNLSVEVALKDGVRHLTAEDDEAATVGTKQAFHAALNVFDDALVGLVQDNQYGVNPLEIRHFYHRFLREELLQSAI